VEARCIRPAPTGGASIEIWEHRKIRTIGRVREKKRWSKKEK